MTDEMFRRIIKSIPDYHLLKINKVDYDNFIEPFTYRNICILVLQNLVVVLLM